MSNEFDDIKNHLKLKIEQDETSLSALITNISPLKERPFGLTLYILFGIMTVGFYTLLCFWVKKFYIK